MMFFVPVKLDSLKSNCMCSFFYLPSFIWSTKHFAGLKLGKS